MKKTIKAAVGRFDTMLGGWMSIEEPALHEESLVPRGTGRYSPEEWTEARKRGYRGAEEGSRALDDDVSFTLRVLTHDTQVRNLVSAHRLASAMNLSRYGSILEVGCGEMVQAIVLKALHPALRYRATDVDPFVVEKVGARALTSNIETGVLDLRDLTPEYLADFGALLCSEVLYALDTDALRHVLSCCREGGADFVAGTSQLSGPIASLYRQVTFPARGIREGSEVRPGVVIRAHGSRCSLGYYRRVARLEGMTVSSLYLPPLCHPSGDNLVWLVFGPLASPR